MQLSNPTTGVTPLPLVATPGDVLEVSSDGEVAAVSSSYTKEKEIRVARSGAYRIKFNLFCSGGDAASGRIYKNGSAVGIVRTTTVLTPGETFTEDIAGWASNDLCQIYAKKDATNSGKVSNFRIYSNVRIDHEVII